MQKKEITIYDIASKLGISASTVSRALKDNSHISDDMVKKIRKTAEKMGYQPNVFAASIRKNKTFTVGIMIPRITSEFMSKAVTAIEEVLNQAGYNIIISQSNELYHKEVLNAKTLFNSRVDGLLVSLSSETKEYSHFESFIKKGIPLVFFDRVCKQVKGSSICVDDYKGGYMLAQHLLEQGRKHIAFIGGSFNRNIYFERFRGVKEALMKSKIEIVSEYVFQTPLTIESGKLTMAKLLALSRKPDAVICCNDNSAVGCIMEIKNQGLIVPDDIAVTGFNNDTVSQIIHPTLTTIHHPVIEMGSRAANQLLEMMNQTNKAADITLDCSLIVRQSG